jgi:hypothetical protein
MTVFSAASFYKGPVRMPFTPSKVKPASKIAVFRYINDFHRTLTLNPITLRIMPDHYSIKVIYDKPKNMAVIGPATMQHIDIACQSAFNPSNCIGGFIMKEGGKIFLCGYTDTLRRDYDALEEYIKGIIGNEFTIERKDNLI